MSKNYCIWFVIACFWSIKPFACFSQATGYSKQSTTSIASDSALLNQYAQTGFEFAEVNRDSSLFYVEKALTISRKLKQKYYEALLLSIAGYTQLSNGEYSKSISALIDASKVAEDNNIGSDILITPFIKQFIKSDDPIRVQALLKGYIKNCLGLLYGVTRNNSRKLIELLQAKEMVEQGKEDYFLLSAINSNIAVAYIDEGKLDSAIYYQFLCVENDKQNKVGLYSGVPFTTIGEIYMTMGKLDSARKYLYQGLSLTEAQEHNFVSLSQSYISLSNYFNKIGNKDSSLRYAKLALQTFSHGGTTIPELVIAYEVLSVAYSKNQNNDSAYKYLTLAKQIGDSLKEREIVNLAKYQNLNYEEQMRLKSLENDKKLRDSRLRIYLLLAGLVVFFIIAYILYRSNQHKQNANRMLEETLENLRSAQSQLIQSEKMASLGELTAGIAHEIQNPLNFVNNFSEVSAELVDEMNIEIDNGNLEDAKEIAGDLKQNLEKISHHGKRAGDIVKGMLQHSQVNSGHKEPNDVNKLAAEYLRLAYQGFRAKDKSFNVALITDFDEKIGVVNIIPQDIGKVMLNLITNAFYVVNEKSKQSIAGYEPKVFVSTTKEGNMVLVSVKDNGNGIPSKILDKIFQPFFTTKPTGQGTGLGLSLSYDIVKAHGGELKVESTGDNGTEFCILLPA